MAVPPPPTIFCCPSPLRFVTSLIRWQQRLSLLLNYASMLIWDRFWTFWLIFLDAKIQRLLWDKMIYYAVARLGRDERTFLMMPIFDNRMQPHLAAKGISVNMHLSSQKWCVCFFFKGPFWRLSRPPPRVVSSRPKRLNLVYCSMEFLWFSCPYLYQMSPLAILASLEFRWG